LSETEDIRKASWQVRDIPNNLLNRRVEITGPVDRKMIINALNANVNVFMADFEDSLSPTWKNIENGLVNMRDAAHRTITFENKIKNKKYELNSDPATLMCRVRGLHLKEKHITCDSVELYGAIVDFAMYLYHNHNILKDYGTGPYFYIPKLQSYHEAKLWNDIISFCEDELRLEKGTVRVTLLIETLPAVFQMEEILFHLKDHIVGLNCGRWDYIFSFIKTLKKFPDKILPDRNLITMNQPFLTAYSSLLVNTCHKRGAFAMGGMAAFVPSKSDDENKIILQKVKNDKMFEINNGHDGTWIAHPGLADYVNEIFDNELGNKNNQIQFKKEIKITSDQLLLGCDGQSSEECLRSNIRISLKYIEAWISGLGCVAIYGLMEDAATAEISRASIWQWIKNKNRLSNGKIVDEELFNLCLNEEFENVRNEIGNDLFENGKFDKAKSIFREITLSEDIDEFLTLKAYEEL
jgi:malate synthase|tara:strand:+ start:9213 stop:10610 length:1398 start_codon:yes stop_codon:yes gene_type:complete